MTIPVTLNNVTNLQDTTTSQNTINTNNASTTTAFVSALNTAGDQMKGNLDMNSNRVLNLPSAATANEPLRLSDLNSFVGGTVTNIPSGGSTGDVLVKTSNTNYAVGWSANPAGIIAGNSIVVSGANPTTVALSGAPVLGTPTSGTMTNCTGLPLSTGVIGVLPVTNGGVGASLSGTGGTSQVLKQVALGANITVGQLAHNDLSDYTPPTTWTPTDASGAGLVLTNNGSNYIKLGKLVIAQFDITYPSTVNGNNASITLPFASNASATNYSFNGDVINSTAGSVFWGIVGNSTTMLFFTSLVQNTLTNSAASTKNFRGTAIYFTS